VYAAPVGASEAARTADAFREQVHLALMHLHDPRLLARHPLAAVAARAASRSDGNGPALRRALVDAVEALRPTERADRAVDRYRILRLRYVDRWEIDAIRSELAIGRSSYFREHAAALETLSRLLGERWGVEHPPVGPVVAGNLPRALTSFVGRHREVGEVAGLLERAPLVTLVGPGGVGKTRLAVEVARRLAPPGGAWFVDLAPIADPGLVPAAAAAPFCLREVAGARLTDTLAEHLRSEQLVLVLDNCEHLVEPSAQLAEALLQTCPTLRIVATSREPLGVPGETTWRVPSLSVPDQADPPAAANLVSFEAVRLFAERARLVDPAFDLDGTASSVAEVCRRLDGIPLAIELAAARVRMMRPQEIAARLGEAVRLLTGGARTALPRQQTLRATIDWSHDLLGEPERVLLRRLAIFAGGFTLEAAEAVCADPPPPLADGGSAPAGPSLNPSDVLDVLTRLVDRSLVIAEPAAGRYRLLETVRQYAAERLGSATTCETVAGPSLDQLPPSQEAETLQRRHSDYFLALAEEAQARWTGPEQTGWLARLELEHDNMRVALSRLRSCGALEEGLRLGMALWNFWWLRGHFSEGRAHLEACLAPVSASTGSAAHAAALTRVAELARIQGDYPSARAHTAHALGICRASGDREGAAVALRELGRLAQEEGDFVASRPYLEESLALQRALGNKPGIVLSLAFLARLHDLEGDLRAARPLFEQSLALARELGDRTGIAVALFGLGRTAFASGERAQARALWCQCLVLFEEVGPRSGIAHALDALAELAVAEDQSERALRLAGAAAALRKTINAQPIPILREQYERWVGLARQALGESASAAAWAAGQASPLAQAIAEALAVDESAP
jgi:predicted ATPase